MTLTEQTAADLIALAAQHHTEGAMFSSAAFALDQAGERLAEGRPELAIDWAVRSLRYSVGIFHPNHARAVVLAEYAAANRAWDASHAVLECVRAAHLRGAVNGDALDAAYAAHRPAQDRLDVAFAAASELSEHAAPPASVQQELFAS